MNRRYDRDIWTKITMVSDCYGSVVLDGKIKIGEKILSDFCMLSVVKIDRALQEKICSDFSDYLQNELPAFLRLDLESGIIILF